MRHTLGPDMPRRERPVNRRAYATTTPAGVQPQIRPYSSEHRNCVRADEVPRVFAAMRPGQYLP